MAYQGLFTQGPTVDDLLQKRNKRQQDMQQQLMNDAAQGARDPQRARMGSMFGSIIGRALGNNSGGADTERAELEARNLQQKEMQQKYSQASMSGTPENNIAFGSELMKMGYIEYGEKLLEKGKADQLSQEEDKIDQRRRDSAISQAIKFNLNAVVSDLKAGGNVDDAMTEIFSAQKIKLAEDGTNKSKHMIAKFAGKSQPFLDKVLNGDFSSMSPTDFSKMLEGKKAVLQNFNNSEGKPQLFPVDEQGFVLDNLTKKWVRPSDLGLSMLTGDGSNLHNTQFTQTTALRKELSLDINVQQYKKSQIEFRKILTSAKAGTAQGDLALIFSYMRMLDPSSTVRESEFQQAEQARGLGDKFYNVYLKTIDGQKMGETQREGFVSVARELYKNVKELAQSKFKAIREITVNNELDENDVFGKITDQQKIQVKFETIDRNNTLEMTKVLESLDQTERKLLDKMIEEGDF